VGCAGILFHRADRARANSLFQGLCAYVSFFFRLVTPLPARELDAATFPNFVGAAATLRGFF
jgi:hypothetical protein